MPDFSSRSHEPELMDTKTFSFAELSRYHKHLEYINRLTLLYGPAIRWLKKQYPENNPATVKIMDVACGRGDMTRQIWRYAIRKDINISVVGIDINPHATQAAKNTQPEDADIIFETRDVFSYSPEEKPDYIFCIQFTHHLKDKELITLITWLDETAGSGWLIYDLHRHPVPYYFIKFLLNLLPVHFAIKNDGPLSVAKAFTKKEWIWHLQQSGIEMSHLEIKWHFPFRYTIACTKHHDKREK